MTSSKTATLSLRIDPGVKEGLRIIAEQERRSLANMVEVLIRDYCKRCGVTVPEQGELLKSEV